MAEVYRGSYGTGGYWTYCRISGAKTTKVAVIGNAYFVSDEAIAYYYPDSYNALRLITLRWIGCMISQMMHLFFLRVPT